MALEQEIARTQAELELEEQRVAQQRLVEQQQQQELGHMEQVTSAKLEE